MGNNNAEDYELEERRISTLPDGREYIDHLEAQILLLSDRIEELVTEIRNIRQHGLIAVSDKIQYNRRPTWK